MEKKAVIAMSGGVDSSVAAYLMKEQGYDAIGITLKLYANEDIGVSREKTCCSLDDVNDARSVAARLGMPFYVLNFADTFEENVIRRFVQAYERGETPNPCIDCNRYIKFRRLMHRAEELGYPTVVTGHYARVEQEEATGRYVLKKGLDEDKDQSYVLYSLTQEELKRLQLPLGSLRKAEVRRIAEENGFVNAHKRDSQDICFVPDGDYAGFIQRYLEERSPEASIRGGNFVGTQGEQYGPHRGIIHYTVGQRKGLGLSFPQPMYVCAIDSKTGEVTLGRQEELFSSQVCARDVNFISRESIPEPLRVKAKIRYRQKEQPGTLVQTGEHEVKLVFDEPQRAVTKGQALVVYEGDSVVCGGVICGTGEDENLG